MATPQSAGVELHVAWAAVSAVLLGTYVLIFALTRGTSHNTAPMCAVLGVGCLHVHVMLRCLRISQTVCSWRAALLVFGSTLLNCALFAACARPIFPRPQRRKAIIVVALVVASVVALQWVLANSAVVSDGTSCSSPHYATATLLILLQLGLLLVGYHGVVHPRAIMVSLCLPARTSPGVVLEPSTESFLTETSLCRSVITCKDLTRSLLGTSPGVGPLEPSLCRSA